MVKGTLPKHLCTQEFVTRVCCDLGHEEGAVCCIKKLVNDHWLHSTSDLRKVPYERLEKWGFPLKFIDMLYDVLAGSQASETVSGFQSYANYTLRPGLARLFAGAGNFQQLREDAERRQNPRLWATKKLQRAFRRRQRRRQRLMEEAATNLLLGELDEKEVHHMSEEKQCEVRLKRAEEKIRRMVRRWRIRKAREAAAGSGSTYLAHVKELDHMADICASGAGSLVAHASIRKCDGQLRECEVTEIFRGFAEKTGHQWEEIEPIAHVIVTFNWISQAEDLRLVEDRHWEDWNVPERLIVLVKGEIEAHRPKGAVEQFTNWVGSFWGD